MHGRIPNIDLLDRTLRQIETHPESWNQSYWALTTPTGVIHCFGGWAIVLSGLEIDKDDCVDEQPAHVVATRLLGLMDCEATSLFHGGNMWQDIERLVNSLYRRYTNWLEADSIDVSELDTQLDDFLAGLAVVNEVEHQLATV